MNSNQVLQCIAKLGIRYNRPQIVKWCLKKRRQQLHKAWRREA